MLRLLPRLNSGLPHSLQLVGIVANLCGLAGLVGLFFFGSPFPPRSRGVVGLAVEKHNEVAKRSERLLDIGSWGSFVIAVVGLVLQLILAAAQR